MRYLLTCALFFSLWGLSWGQVSRVEYFVDTDPGLGQGVAVSFAPGADISASFTVPLTAVSLGFHTLYVRTRDAQQHWSLTSQQAFYTTVLAPANQALTAAEYFIDQEPGLGQGTPIGLAAGQASTTVSFSVSLSTVNLGFHTLYLRTRDAQGAWSLTQSQAFYVLNMAPTGQALARAEYFIDQDPGLGNGTAVALPASQTAVTQAFNVPLTNVATGAHTLYLRVLDKNKAWSLTAQQAFLVKPGGGLATITAFEYYFTGTGANASYTSSKLRYAVPTPAASVSLSFAADLSQLPGNADYDLHVWAVSSEGLRSLVQTKRIRACNNLPVKAGFDLAQDGRQVYFVNQSANADRYRWSFGDGTTDTTANPLHTYAAIGNYTVRLISRSFCNPDTVTKVVSILGLKDITTNHGGNTGAVSVVVTGAGFVPGMQLKLQRAGQADIVGAAVVVRNISTITARFDLTGKSIGQWDVVVTYPGGFTASLLSGFTIEASRGAQLAVTISGSSSLRIGFQQVYTITCANTGNQDAYQVPLIISGLPLGTIIRPVGSLVSPSIVPGLDTLGVAGYPLPYTMQDTAAGESYRILRLPTVVAGAEIPICVIFDVPPTTPVGSTRDITVTVKNPESPYTPVGAPGVSATACLAYWKEKAVDATIERTAGLIPGATNFNGINSCVEGGIGIVNGKWEAYSREQGFFNYIIDNSGYMASVYKASLGCARTAASAVGLGGVVTGNVPLVIGVVALNNRLEKLEKAGNLVFTALDRIKFFRDCGPLYGAAGKNFLRTVFRNSADPNAKYGPGGGSTHHYINKNAPLAYTVSFENIPTATINAQTVRVTDTLSTQAFNLATFAFTSVTVGEQTYTLPASAKSFVHDFDFVAQYGVKARVVGTFDAVAGIAHWTFFSIDPVTSQVTTNVLAGFLPPDVISPKGQGYVSFTVQASPTRQTGDIIHNRASIIFDYNAPILTNNWHNTFDLVLPASAVTGVITTSVDSVFHVNWSGTDIGSAIQDYDIIYTVNGHRPQPWLVGTSTTTALFTGRRDSTYCFYSIARDSAGNVEAAPLVPDACKSVALSQQAAAAAASDGFTLYPNPTPGLFTVEAYALKPEQANLRIEDVLGHIVYSDNLRLRGGTQRQELDISRFANGMYFVKLSVNGKTTVRKLLKN